MRVNQLAVVICFLLLVASSCKHELEDPQWTVDLVAPIAKTELSLTDLLNDSIVNIEILEDESLLLVYHLEIHRAFHSNKVMELGKKIYINS